MKLAQVGQVLQPIQADDGFVTLKLLSKKESVNQSFEEAKAEVTQMYKHQKAREALVKLAKESLKDFKGTDIGFVSFDNGFVQPIPTLQDTQQAHFLSQVFGSQESEGYVLFDDKVVLYRVLEQSLAKSGGQEYENDTEILAKGAKLQAILDSFVEYLDKTYKTTIYIDVSK